MGLLSKLFLLYLFLIMCRTYSVQGRWLLDHNDKYEQISTSIQFDFQKRVNSGKIQHKLNIFACDLMKYSFDIVENQIYLTFEEISPRRSPCRTAQVSQIRRLLDKVAFTTTIANNLILLSPSGKILFKLSKIKQRPLLTAINGAFDVSELRQEPASVYVQANSSQVQLCNGDAVIDYQFQGQNQINFDIRQVNGCDQNQLFTEAFRARYVRRHGRRQLYFYDITYRLTMKWNKLAQVGWRQQLFPSRRASEAIQPTEQITIKASEAIKPTEQITRRSQETSQQKQQVMNINIDEQNQESNSQNNEQIQPKTQNPQSTSQNQQKLQEKVVRETKTQSQVKNKQTQIINNNSQNVSVENIEEQLQNQQNLQEESNEPANQQSQPQTQSVNLIHSTSQDYKKPITLTDIRTKWFPKTNQQQQLGYSLIILPNRILITSCSTIHSLVSFQGGQDGKMRLSNIDPKSTDPECSQQNKNIIEMLQNLNYVTITQNNDNSKLLKLWSKQNQLIEVLTNVVQR